MGVGGGTLLGALFLDAHYPDSWTLCGSTCHASSLLNGPCTYLTNEPGLLFCTEALVGQKIGTTYLPWPATNGLSARTLPLANRTPHPLHETLAVTISKLPPMLRDFFSIMCDPTRLTHPSHFPGSPTPLLMV